MSTTHLTLRQRNILANLGTRRPDTATPYVDRARIDTIVAAEHFRAQRAQAKRPHEGPPTPTRAARWLNNYRTLQRIAGSALYSFAGVCIGAGALAVLLAKQPVLDAETERANAAEAHAAKLASTLQAVGGGHVTVNLTGPAHQVARAAQAASALIWIDEAANVKHAATLTRGAGK